MSSNGITLAGVLRRLREIHGVSSDEDLARKLNKPLRTLARHKNGEPVYFQKVIALLDQAQMLSDRPVDPAVANLERARQAAVQIADGLEELRAALSGE